MPRLWRLAIRNWWSSPGRTAAALLSVALGVATVVLITGFYETGRRAITDEVVVRWVGTSHVSVEPPGAHWGLLEADFAEEIRTLPNVKHVAPRLHRRAVLNPEGDAKELVASDGIPIDTVGIDPATSAPFRPINIVKGRLFDVNEVGVAVIENQTAETLGIGPGDSIRVSPYWRGKVSEYRVVGTFPSHRLAEFQKPVIYMPLPEVQALFGQEGGATIIEVQLQRDDPADVVKARERIEALVDARDVPYKVTSAEGRQEVINEAERVSRLVLVLAACVSMLTSFFIILTTMSVSLLQRRGALGVMRCVGMTRAQLGGLLLLELMPLGALGTVIGVGVGMLAATLIAAHPDVEVTRFYFSRWGMVLAVASGIMTTLLACLFLIYQVVRVSPLEAVYHEARKPRVFLVVIAGLVGLVLIGTYELLWRSLDAADWLNPVFPPAAMTAQYVGYLLLAPALVVFVGGPAARLIGPLLGINGRLARDQFGKTPWRSGGVCCMLLVGMSLIVYISVRAQAFYSVWAFHAHLPETFIYAPQFVASDKIDVVASHPGVADVIVASDVVCDIVSRDAVPRRSNETLFNRLMKNLHRPVFVAGDIDELIDMIKVGFAEGTLEEALEKLRAGGHVLIPTQTAQSEDLHLGDTVRIRIGKREADFVIAGVVQSPSLDVAVTFFQAESYMEFAAAQALLGTREDLRDKLGLDVVTLFLCDLDFPESAWPPEFKAEEDVPNFSDREVVVRAMLDWVHLLPNHTARLRPVVPELQRYLDDGTAMLSDEAEEEVRRFGLALRYIGWRWDKRTPDLNWQVFRERLLLLTLAAEIGHPDAVIGSAGRIREALERSLRRAMAIMTWMPAISLIVAAIGIGNLMMVSVHARSRQIAILRAVGAQRGQIVRLVLAEAATLGVLGSLLGFALGVHQGFSVNEIAGRISGVYGEFIIPWGTVLGAFALTITVCVVAGLIPARYAARSNIVAAMQTT